MILNMGGGGVIPKETLDETTITPGTEDQVVDAGTYLRGDLSVSGDANLIPENIRKDVNIFGVDGTHEGVETIFKGLNIVERREDGSASKICLNYDGETLDNSNGLGSGSGSNTICSADEVEIIADTLNDNANYSIAFYITSNCQKAKLKIKDQIYMMFASATIQFAKKLWVSDVTTINFNSTGTYRYGLGSSYTEKIYAQPDKKPSGWDSRWNYYSTSNCNTVVWGVSESEFDAL